MAIDLQLVWVCSIQKYPVRIQDTIGLTLPKRAKASLGTPLYFSDPSHLALGLIPTAKHLLRLRVALKQVELLADEVLILLEQTQSNLWLSFKRS